MYEVFRYKGDSDGDYDVKRTLTGDPFVRGDFNGDLGVRWGF